MTTISIRLTAAQRQEAVTDFLKGSGMWLTNEKTHRAALAEAWEEGAQATLRNVQKSHEDSRSSPLLPVYERNPYTT